MKTLILSILFGRDELAKLFATLPKHRSAVRKLRADSAKLESEAEAIQQRQTQNTTTLKASILTYNDTRAALTKSFDL